MSLITRVQDLHIMEKTCGYWPSPSKALRQLGDCPRWVPEPRYARGQRHKKPRGAWRRRHAYLQRYDAWRFSQSAWWRYAYDGEPFHPIGPPVNAGVTAQEMFTFVKEEWFSDTEALLRGGGWDENEYPDHSYEFPYDSKEPAKKELP